MVVYVGRSFFRSFVRYFLRSFFRCFGLYFVRSVLHYFVRSFGMYVVIQFVIFSMCVGRSRFVCSFVFRALLMLFSRSSCLYLCCSFCRSFGRAFVLSCFLYISRSISFVVFGMCSFFRHIVRSFCLALFRSVCRSFVIYVFINLCLSVYLSFFGAFFRLVGVSVFRSFALS